jgi:hypothetical protein
MAATISANSAGGGGLVSSGDASGVLALQTAGVTALSISAAQVVSFTNPVALTSTTLTTPTLTTPTINSAQVPTISGTAPLYMCRAWVNFNGTGAVAIRASGNVSYITDNGVGAYTVNFTTAMPDVNYAVASQGGITGASGPTFGVIQPFYSTGATREAPLVGSFKISCENSGGTMTDPIDICLAIFR